MEIVFIGLALSVCCFGIWRYGKTLRRGGCCGSGAVSPVKRRVADRDETHYPYTAVLTIDGMALPLYRSVDHRWYVLLRSDGRNWSITTNKLTPQTLCILLAEK